MNKTRRILWFRRDLRVLDNPLLALDGEVLPIFIFDKKILSKLEKNDRRVTFIFQAVVRLKEDLKKINLDLAIFYGEPTEIFKSLTQEYQFDEVAASGDYDSYALERDREVSHILPFNFIYDTYIFRPNEILKSDGSPYLVFTPFYNKSKDIFTPNHLKEFIPVKQKLISFNYSYIHEINKMNFVMRDILVETIGFEYQILTPHQLLLPSQKLEIFKTKISTYPKGRDFMILDATSGLSTDLRFGTISIRSILRWLVETKKSGIDTEPFFRQLIFRDFYAMLLYHFPYLENINFRYKFYGVENNTYMEAFFSGKTGVPIVDAGIKQLLETGEIHNRVRMIVASFFTKNLLLPWQAGEAFFAKHLMDYDASANILSWQWSAGTGVDPQPYFRIFNPYTQSGKFDKEGLYIKKYLPQLNSVSPKLFSDEELLFKANIDDYPKPIVNHKDSSKKALEHFRRQT